MIPKFFKMDNLSKLGFLAADYFLRQLSKILGNLNNIALAFSNSCVFWTQIGNQDSIMDKENYFLAVRR